MSTQASSRRVQRRRSPAWGVRVFAAASLSLVGVFVAATSSLGCHNLTVHSFVGQHYDPANDCLEVKTLIDVIEGDAHGTCTGVRCFAFQSKDASGKKADGDVYVSTSCTSTPDFRDGTEDPDGSVCALALKAYARSDGACKTNV